MTDDETPGPTPPIAAFSHVEYSVLVHRQRISHLAARSLRYLWALPTSLIGLAFAFCAWRIGAQVTARAGILEVHGPGVQRIADALAPNGYRIRAFTLGHVVLARDLQVLESTRAHEAAHVRQFERWGPILIPAYIVGGVVAGCRGSDSYRDNIFERRAPSPE